MKKWYEVIIIFSFFIFSYTYSYALKVLMVVPTFPKIHDICMLNQITGLLDRGVDVHIYASRYGDTQVMQKEIVEYGLLSRTIIGDQLPKNINKYDVVIFQLGHKACNIKKTHGFNGKVIICLRGYDITGFVKKNPHAYDEFFTSCDLFMPVCYAFKKILEKLGCDQKKIAVHHSSIDCSRFAFKQRTLPEEGTINIISAGRFVEKKGFLYSIIAIANIIKRYPNVRYTIIGDGELKKKHLDLIQQLGMWGKIKLIPWQQHEEYIKMLDRSHIFILPSVTAKNNDQEGIPNVLKEAMAMGLIVIATKHSGNEELIKNRVSGFLVPERDSRSIVRAVEYILSHTKEWERIQHAARKIVEEEFDNEKVNDALENILLKLVGKRSIDSGSSFC